MYKNKRKLIGKNSPITESVTTTHVGLLKEAQGKYEERNVLTIDDRILYRENNRAFLYKK